MYVSMYVKLSKTYKSGPSSCACCHAITITIQYKQECVLCEDFNFVWINLVCSSIMHHMMREIKLLQFTFI